MTDKPPGLERAVEQAVKASAARKEFGARLMRALERFMDSLPCELDDARCRGKARVYACPNGCGYSVRRCAAHGGRSLGGALGGHIRICKARELADGSTDPAGGRYECKLCGRRVRRAALNRHLYDEHGLVTGVREVLKHFAKHGGR